jgi:hypothetical protein
VKPATDVEGEERIEMLSGHSRGVWHLGTFLGTGAAGQEHWQADCQWHLRAALD